ncbi:sugar transferase [Nocardioides marinquilinus]
MSSVVRRGVDARRVDAPVHVDATLTDLRHGTRWDIARRLRREARRALPHYVVLSDVLAVALATLGSTLVNGAPRPHDPFVVLGCVTAVHAGLRAYRPRLQLSVLDDLPAMFAATLAALVALLAFGSVGLATVPKRELAVGMVVLGVSLVLARSLCYAVVRSARRSGLIEHRTLVLGAGPTGRQLAEAMLAHPEYGLRPVGFVDADLADDAASLPVPMLGHTRDLVGLVRREGVTEVIVADPADDLEPGESAREAREAREARLVEALHACDLANCEIFTVPRLHELYEGTRDVDHLWGIPIMRARRATWRSSAWRVKRMLDVVLGALALLVLSPILAVVALAVRLEVGPRVLFRQVRVGLDGRQFTLLKFRSIQPEPESDDTDTAWSVAGERIGPVGRFIRATSLDELPQLLNILHGEMSIVGPRPERPAFVEEFTQAIPRYTARHRVPAGLTGWAQVNGLRGDTSIEERVRFDNHYIQNWSLWFDVKIVARTLGVVLLRRGS